MKKSLENRSTLKKSQEKEESKIEEFKLGSMLESHSLNRTYSESLGLNDSFNSDSGKKSSILEKQKSLQISHLMEEKSQTRSKFGKRATLKNYVLDKMSLSSKKEPMMKIGHKEFMNELEEVSSLFKSLSHCEESYGKGVQGLSMKDIRIKETYQFQLNNLSENEKLLIAGRLMKSQGGNEVLLLPSWKKLKETLYFVGSTHISCSVGIERVTFFLDIDLTKK